MKLILDGMSEQVAKDVAEWLIRHGENEIHKYMIKVGKSGPIINMSKMMETTKDSITVNMKDWQ